MSQQSKRADLNKAVTLYTKRLLHALTEGNPVEQEEIDALNEMREAAGLKPLAIAITTQGKAPEPKQQRAPEPERKQPQSERKPSGQQYTRQQDADHDPESVAMVPISVGGNRTNAHLMPDNAQWTNRFMIRSESSNRLYTIAQNKNRRYWGCNCPGWISRRNCKHLRALGLPGNEAPYEAKLNKGASVLANRFPVRFAGEEYSELAHVLAAELIHSDNELSKMMETVPEVQGGAHIEGPEAGPSNDEFHENTHEEFGVPVTDGKLKPTERPNLTAIKDAIEGKAEMEIGKPVAEKQEEVAIAEAVRDDKAMNPGTTQEVSAKPGTQIIINVGSKSAAKKCTNCKTNLGGWEFGKTLGCHDCNGEFCSAKCVDEHETKTKHGKTAAKKVAYVSHCPGHRNSKGELAEWCIKQHNTDKILESFKSEGAAKEGLKNMESHKHGADEGGAWSISGVTPNTETTDDVNAALKRMKANKTAADHVHTPHDPDTTQTVCEYCGIDMEYDGVADVWSCGDGTAVSDEELAGDEEVPRWVDAHSVNCAKCGELVDERECVPGPDGVGDICPKCQGKQGAEGLGGENQPGATAGHAGGMFGGSDLEGPDFKVGFTFRGTAREASFSSLKEAHAFIKSASAKFGKMAGDWTMKCPACGGSATKQNREDSYVCPKCGWNSHTAAPKKASAKTADSVNRYEPADWITPNAAKKLIAEELTKRGMPFEKLKAKTVGFSDLARGSALFVQIYGAKPDPQYAEIKQLAKQNGFLIEVHGPGIVGSQKEAAVDPAKRNLVLELLKGQNLTTGEIEKRLGGGKYTNMAYPVLQELAKEGLVKHKQMRWYLKAAATSKIAIPVVSPGICPECDPRGMGPEEELCRSCGRCGDCCMCPEFKTEEGAETAECKYCYSPVAPGHNFCSEECMNSFNEEDGGMPPRGVMGADKKAERTIMPAQSTKPSGAYGYQDISGKAMPIAQPVEKSAPSWVTSSKKYNVKRAGEPMPSSFSIETRMSEGHPLSGDAGIRTIADQLNTIYKDLKMKNPQGFMDSFEQQLPARMMEIGKQHGVQVEHNPEDNVFRFYDQAGASTKGQKHEELQASDKTAGPTKAKRLLQQAARLVFQMSQQNAAGLIDMNKMEGLCSQHATAAEVAKLMIDGYNPQIMFLEQKDADHAMCIACGEALAEYRGDEEEDWTRNYDKERDHKSYTGSLKTATIRVRDGSKKAGDGMAKTVESEKEAGFNFFFPGQVLKEFYPEVQHEIVDYPNANNQPMGLEVPEMIGDGGHELEGILDEALNPSVIEMIQLPADIGEIEPLAMAAADYSSTSPAGGMGIGRDGKPEVLEGAPLRKENDVRGYMFTDEFYGQYEGVPGAAMNVASKTAAEGDDKQQFSLFLKKVCGEIAATMVAAFKVTSRPLLDKVPGIGELQLDVMEQGQGATMPAGQTTQGGRVKYLMSKLNDSDIKAAINDAWAQAAVWNDNAEGGFVYEVFVRPETIDTDSLQMKYKFVCGTRE